MSPPERSQSGERIGRELAISTQTADAQLANIRDKLAGG
jgi:DNA-binding CsgD family transcriptional regulator